MSSMSLTTHAVRQMVNGNLPATTQPVLQVLMLKKMNTGGSDRFRLVLSDGVHSVQGMLATQHNHIVDSGQLDTLGIIRLQEHLKNFVSGRHLIIVLKLEIVVPAHPTKMGAPVDIEKHMVNGHQNAENQHHNQPLYGANTAATTATTSAPLPSVTPYHSNNNRPSSGNNNPYGGGGGSSGQKTSQQAAAPPIQRVAASTTGTAANGVPITPIANLNMYQNRWTIQARVTNKSPIKTWSNAKGEGSLFSMELLDASGVDIRCTLFKEAVDRFYHQIVLGKVYTISGGRLKVANQQYNTCQSPLEMTLDQNSEIQLATDHGDIETQHYDFVPSIAALEHIDVNKYVDVLAVVQSVGDCQHIMSTKTGRELDKCDAVLIDTSNTTINCTFWGEQAQQAPQQLSNHPVVALRRAKLSDYGGRSLSAGDSMQINPTLEVAQQLGQWWREEGSNPAAAAAAAAPVKMLSGAAGGGSGNMAPLTQRNMIADIVAQKLGFSAKPDYITLQATIQFIKKDKEGGAWYTACANASDPCKNMFKVTQTTDGQWYCDKCTQTYNTCVRRWIFSAVVEDASGSTWVSFFNEQAETLLGGTTADAMYAEQANQDVYDSLFAAAVHTEWLLKCKVKNEMVNDEARVKTSVLSLVPLDHVQESRDMLAALGL